MFAMHRSKCCTSIKKIELVLFLGLLFPPTLFASFIESTIGTAVVNDATATYYNPAALTLLKNPQIIGLGSVASFRSRFTGEASQSSTGFTLSGNSSAKNYYYLPSFYLGTPATNKISVGLALVSNFFNRDMDSNSILRYAQSNNQVQDVDVVSAIGIKLNDYLSFGAGVNMSYANFILKPITGFPSLNIPDSQSTNKSDGNGVGSDVGLLLKLSKPTLIGFNYRSAVTYKLSGTSTFEGHPEVISNHYHLTFWTPARSVISINQFLTPNLGLISTIQYIQWNIFKEVHIHGIATQIGTQSVILDANVPYHLHNAWLFTLGSHYRITPKWIIRAAATYNQSPGNSDYQISNGDSIILGASTGYEINQHVVIDGSYAHAFIQSEDIHITNNKNIINGINNASRDAVSLKITINL